MQRPAAPGSGFAVRARRWPQWVTSAPRQAQKATSAPGPAQRVAPAPARVMRQNAPAAECESHPAARGAPLTEERQQRNEHCAPAHGAAPVAGRTRSGAAWLLWLRAEQIIPARVRAAPRVARRLPGVAAAAAARPGCRRGAQQRVRRSAASATARPRNAARPGIERAGFGAASAAMNWRANAATPSLALEAR